MGFAGGLLPAAAQLARLLMAEHAAALNGEIYLITRNELCRVATPSVERTLVRSTRRLRTDEVEGSLADWRYTVGAPTATTRA